MSQTESAPWTVARLLAWTREHFERSGVDSPRLAAEILLAHAMSCERIQLFARYETTPEPDVLQRFRDAVRSAAEGKPIAYLTGVKEFFSLAFDVSPDVLIPRPETEILVERTIALVRKSGGALRTILDVGAGSGCIAVSLAKNLPECRICASDISPAALAIARKNATRHGVADPIEFREGDLLAAWSESPAAADRAAFVGFDIIVANLPYVATRVDNQLASNVRDHEPHLALFAGEDGLDLIRRLIADTPRRLAPGGHLLLEIAYDQAVAVRALFAGSAWSDVVAYRDGGGIERVIHARRRVAVEQVA